MIEIVVNGHPRNIHEGTTLETLVAELKLQPRQVAVEVNRELVPRGEHAIRKIQPGDQLEIVSLAGGG
jgi:sulfur carrier protein